MATNSQEIQNLMNATLHSDAIEDVTRVETKEGDHSNRAAIRKVICKRIWQTTLPLVFVGSLSSLEVYIRSKLIANEGSKNLAVEGLHATTFGFILATDSGLLNPAVSLMSQAFGAEALEEIGRVAQQGWLLGLGLSIPTMAIMLNAEGILNLFGQDPELTSVVGQYARAACGASPAIYWLSIDLAILKTTNRSRIIIPMTVVSALVGIGMSYLLIPGNLGFPKQGVVGSGYATLTQVWVSWLGLKAYFSTRQFRPYKLFQFRFRNFEQLRKFFKFGSPTAIASGIDQVRYFMCGMMIGWLGPLALALNQATDIYLQFTIPPILGIRQGTQVFVGQYKGLQDYRNMRLFGNLGILLENCVLALPLILYATIPDRLAANFLSEDEVDDLDTKIRLVFITKILSRILETVQGPAAENLKALLDNCFVSVVQMLSSLVLILPMSYVMAFVFDWDLVGINTAIMLGAGASVPPLLYRWYQLSREPNSLGSAPEQNSGDNREKGIISYDSLVADNQLVQSSISSTALSSEELDVKDEPNENDGSITLQPLMVRQFDMTKKQNNSSRGVLEKGTSDRSAIFHNT